MSIARLIARVAAPGALLALLLPPLASPAAALAAEETAAPAPDQTVVDGEEVVLGRIPGMVMAEPKVRKPPRYPAAMADRRREGWVVVSTTVRTDGTVADVRVVDASDEDLSFDEAAIKAIKEWTYTPATLAGVPVEQTNRLQKIYFMIDGERGARSKVIRKMRDFDKALAAKEFDEAAGILTELRTSGMNLYEFGHYFVRQGSLHEVTGKPQLALHAYRRALLGGRDVLDARLFANMLHHRLRLELGLGHIADALITYERLGKQARRFPEDDQVMKVAADIAEAVKDPSRPLAVEGELALDCRSESLCGSGLHYWSHRLLRRNVQFEAAEGEFKSIAARCDTVTAETELAVGSSWQIPESWGACTLHVVGSPGAKIRLLEF